MRNLKRALSLALASVMVLGLMVVGSGASYADVTSEENQEAIEVLQAVGVMVGDDEGNFNPDKNVTRNEMAVVMSNLLDLKVEDFNAADIPFTDVPSWAVSYVAACYADGITSGTSATTYGGSNTVTAAQAALMVMKALGYFQYDQDFGDDWQLATISQANRISLFNNVESNVREPMTRNDVAQLVLNTLETGTVEASTGGSISVGDITIVNDIQYNYVTSGSSYAKAINSDLYTSNDGQYSSGSIVQLGEQLYSGDLTREDGTDAFGRPAAVWAYENEEIGRYAEGVTYTFTGKVTPDDLYDAVGRTATKYDTWSVYVDGEDVNYDGDDLYSDRNDDDNCFLKDAEGAAQTGNGVLTQVYVDSTNETVSISVIHTYVAEVARVRDDGDETYITLNDLTITNGPASSSDRYETDLFDEDEIVLYTFAENAIQSVVAAEQLSGEVTRVTANTSFVVDGETYKYTFGVDDGAKVTTSSVDNDVVAYLDSYGYVIYIDESAITYDYAFVLDVGYTNGRYTSDPQFGATLLLTDGSKVKADLDVPDSVFEEKGSKSGDGEEAETTNAKTLEKVIAAYKGYIVSYTVDDGKYTLITRSEVAASTETGSNLDINNDRSKMIIGKENEKDKVVYANANTVFLLDDGDDNYTVYTGIKNVPDITGNSETEAVYYGLNGSDVARVVYVKNADVEGEGSVIFIEADKGAKAIKDSEGNYYELNAVVDGEITTILVKTETDAAKALVTGATGTYMVAYKSLVYNSDGLVTDVRDLNKDDVQKNIIGTREYERNDDTVGLGYDSDDTTYYTYSDDVVVVYYDGDDLRTARITSVGDDKDDSVIAVFDDGQIIGLCITENDGETEPEVTGYEVVSFNNDPMEITADTNGITLKCAKVVDSNGGDHKYGSATLTAVIELYDRGWDTLETLTQEVKASTDAGKEHILADKDNGLKLESELLTEGDRIRVTLTLSNKEMGDITIYDGYSLKVSAAAEGGAGA